MTFVKYKGSGRVSEAFTDVNGVINILVANEIHHLVGDHYYRSEPLSQASQPDGDSKEEGRAATKVDGDVIDVDVEESDDKVDEEEPNGVPGGVGVEEEGLDNRNNTNEVMGRVHGAVAGVEEGEGGVGGSKSDMCKNEFTLINNVGTILFS
ncbi:hypothetical protein Fmac_015962 [Flemingia macrophylla]|uniref:Uncharacterized protein n=1 Tax=Flemingia macrophylla TaxID=520843 RepID=A0ABD1MG21_9FABA